MFEGSTPTRPNPQPIPTQLEPLPTRLNQTHPEPPRPTTTERPSAKSNPFHAAVPGYRHSLSRPICCVEKLLCLVWAIEALQCSAWISQRPSFFEMSRRPGFEELVVLVVCRLKAFRGLHRSPRVRIRPVMSTKYRHLIGPPWVGMIT